MNSLPDSLKLNYEIEPENEVVESQKKEVISESGSVMKMVIDELPFDPTIPLEKPDDLEPDLPMFVPKPKPVKHEIFAESVPTAYIAPKPEVKLTKKGKPRKPMSDEHKAKLAIAREKANAKKRYLKTQRDAKKAEAQAAAEAPVKQTVKQDPEGAPVIVKSPSVKYVGVTQEQLEQSHLKAILTAETLRKKRKEEKKAKVKEQEYARETMKTIQKLSWKETSGIYANCF